MLQKYYDYIKFLEKLLKKNRFYYIKDTNEI